MGVVELILAEEGLFLSQLIPVGDVVGIGFGIDKAPVFFTVSWESDGVASIAQILSEDVDAFREGLLLEWGTDSHVLGKHLVRVKPGHEAGAAGATNGGRGVGSSVKCSLSS